MLLLVVGLTLCASSYGLIPPSPICYQHTTVRNACLYGNLTVALIGNTLKPKDCNSSLQENGFAHPPFIYINSTNATERFTVVMLDMGPDGTGPPYLHWMVTNVSINSLPNYAHLRPGDTVADYREPLLLYGTNRPNLIQILVFRHQNVLRVPFGELYIVKRSFDLSQLFSNTRPNLKLCGPVAGTQYWVYGSRESNPSAPPLPPVPAQPSVPHQPGYVPVQPGVPSQSGYVPPQPVQPGYHQPAQPNVIPVQPPYNTPPSSPHHNFSKKSSGNMTKPILLVYLFILFAVIFV